MEYASSIWSPLGCSTSIRKLQVMQNAVLRTATGCTQDINIRHLHDETLILPIHEHLQLHASQYKQKTPIKRYFPASLVAPLPNSEQTNHPSSNHTYTQSTPKHIHHHYAPSTTLSHHRFNCTHIRPWICVQTLPECLHCWPDGRRSSLVAHKQEDRTSPTSKGHGSGQTTTT